jgi:tetratricopeptide (TPR) repeat protein
VSDIHITKDLLDAVFLGRAPARMLAEIGLQHLMALCPHCHAEFEAWRRARSASTAIGAALKVLPVLLERESGNAERARQRAERDLRVLLDLAHSERLARVQRATARFRGLSLARLLLKEAKGHIPTEPRLVYELAETAQAVLIRTPVVEGMADLHARAAAYMGNARRAEGDLPAAEARFAFARHLVTHSGVVDSLVLAELDWFEGTLRKDERRFVDAEELLVRAVTLYRLAGEEALAAYPLVTLGLLFFDRQDYRRALETFRVVLRLIHPEADSRLYCYAFHNLTLSLCEVGDFTAAEEALSSGRDLYHKHPDLYTRSRTLWLEGKIAAGLGS